MNQIRDPLYKENESLLDVCTKFALEWVLPVSLAVIVGGQIFFSAAKYHLGLEHPSWPFWGLLAAAVGLVFLRQVLMLRATQMDIAMLYFIVILSASYLILGAGNPFKVMSLIITYIVFPYLSGRLMSYIGIRRLIIALSLITMFSLPLITFGLINVFELESYNDRVSTLFNKVNLTTNAGVSTIPHASISLGLFLVLLTSIFCFFGLVRRVGHQFLALTFLCVTTWYLVFLGLRSVILISLIMSATLITFIPAPLKKKIAMLLTLVSVFSVSWMTVPSERRDHIYQINSIAKNLDISHEEGLVSQTETDFDQTPIGRDCYIHGNSVATRMLLYESALDLFLKSPIIGVGAGNYSIKAYCNSEDALKSPHSVLLQILSELGLVGVLAYLLLIYRAISGLLQVAYREGEEYSRLAWVLGGVWGFFFLLDSISGNYFNGYHFFAVTGLIGGFLASRFEGRDARLNDWAQIP